MEEFILAYVIVTLVSLAILYGIIRAGVKHGTTSALREHEIWMRDGSLQQTLDRHAERLAEREALTRYEAAQAERDRG